MSGRRMRGIGALLVAAALAAPAPAAAGCTAAADANANAGAAPGFAGWSRPAGPVLAVGAPALLRLAPIALVNFSPPPRPGRRGGGYGGIHPLQIVRAGRYAIATAAAIGIEITDGKGLLRSEGQRRGPLCSGIATIVDYRLEPGNYVIQLFGAPTPSVRTMVIAREGSAGGS